MKTLIATLLFASAVLAGASEQLISTTTIGVKNPAVYEFFADSNLLRRYSTDSLIVPNLTVTLRTAAVRVKNAVERAYGFPIQNMIIQQIGSTPLASNPLTHLLQLEGSEKTRMLYLWGLAGDEAGLKSEM